MFSSIQASSALLVFPLFPIPFAFLILSLLFSLEPVFNAIPTKGEPIFLLTPLKKLVMETKRSGP